MSGRLMREAYEKLIEEDIEWLMRQPRSLEQEHIKLILELSPDRVYGKKRPDNNEPTPDR